MFIDNNCLLSTHTTIRLGGRCHGFFPEKQEELVSLLSQFERQGTAYRIVGQMSNILPPDTYAQNKVIFTHKICDVKYQKDTITLSCGVKFSRLILGLCKDDKIFYPSLIGIPGLVGGMVCQNASCYGDEISSAFLWAELYSTKEKKIVRFDKSDMNFSYRSSVLKMRELVLLNATFAVRDGNASDIIKVAVQKRKAAMPQEPSLGSVFLRRQDVSIGYLLDRLGQKGRQFGGISVSKKHAGVLINHNGGTSSEYRLAVSVLQKLIQENYGFTPDTEVEFLI